MAKEEDKKPKEILEDIYNNVSNNIKRYWVRTWLVDKLYHDNELCDAINESDDNIIHSYTNIRESLIDSSIVCIYKGVFDLGDDSLSLTRLIPSSCDYLAEKKEYRIDEENIFYTLLKEQWYKGTAPDNTFDDLWKEIIDIVKKLRKTDKVKRVLEMRNKMIAHSLDKAIDDFLEYGMLHELRNDMIPIMNKLSAFFENNNTEWSLFVSDCERISLGYRRLLTTGLKQL